MFIIFQKSDTDTISLRVVVDLDNILDELQKVKDEYDPDAYITTAVPDNRIFRNAWCRCPKGRSVLIDELKAQSLHIDRIRQIRNKKLIELDAEQLRNITNSDQLAEIEARKQLLRDIPQTFDVSRLDIKKPHTLWPEGLDLHRDYLKDQAQ